MCADTPEGDRTWIAEEFADLRLHDTRLEARCREVAAALEQQPPASINQACEDWAATKAAYRLFANDKVSPAQLLAPHAQRTVTRLHAHPVVLAVQDTTFFNYTQHPHTEGLGEIGNKREQQRGFGMHSTLALTPQGLPLGLLTQAFFTRPIGQPAHTRQQVRQLPIADKESYRWLVALEQTLALAPAGVQVVTVCDREADLYEMFVLAQDRTAALLVRASHDRALADGTADGTVPHLWRTVARRRPVGELTLHLAGNQSRAARTAHVRLRFCPVTLKPPWRPQPEKLERVTLTALLVREVRPPPGCDEPVEWLLLTNLPVTDAAAAREVVDWYGCRWQIEDFHKVVKSGCRVEACRLGTATRLQNYIALMSVVAWRLHWLTYVNRTDPEAPCTAVLTTSEWHALYARIHKTSAMPPTPPSVHQALRWIARLGGFLGRKSDGEPGITVIWRGWQRLQDMAATWSLATTGHS